MVEGYSGVPDTELLINHNVQVSDDIFTHGNVTLPDSGGFISEC